MSYACDPDFYLKLRQNNVRENEFRTYGNDFVYYVHGSAETDLRLSRLFYGKKRILNYYPIL